MAAGRRSPRAARRLLLVASAACALTLARQGLAWVSTGPASGAGTAAAESNPARQQPRRAAAAALLLGPWLAQSATEPASAAGLGRVVVLGGSGFVGSRICERLVADGASVASVSRSGGPPSGAGAWAAKVEWLKGDVATMDLNATLQGADAVVSAVGALGSADDETANGRTAENAAGAAAAAGAKRFVLVSATPMVAEAGLGAAFPGYVAGKRRAEAAAAAFPGSSMVLQPTFIFGGDKFNANPPRVAEWYGEQVEGLLGTGLFRAAASVSPAFLKLALSPPSSVADVAAAAVAGAAGRSSGVVSGHDAIRTAAA